MIGRKLLLFVITVFMQPAFAEVCDIQETSFGDGMTYVTVFIVTKDGHEIHRTIYKNEAQSFAQNAPICGGKGIEIPPSPLLEEGNYRGTNHSAWFFKGCSIEIRNGSDGKLRVISVQDSDSVFNLWLNSDGVAYEASAPNTVVALGQIGFDSFYKGVGKNVYSTSIEEKAGYFSLIVNRDLNRIPMSYVFEFKTSAETEATRIDCSIN